MKNKYLLLSILIFIFSCDNISVKRGSSNTNISDSIYTILENHNASIPELEGKVLFLNYWEYWCKPCIAEIPILNQLYKDFEKNNDIIFLAISEETDSIKAQKVFNTNEEFLFTQYKAKKGIRELSCQVKNKDKILQTCSIPMSLLVNKKGKVVETYISNIDEDELTEIRKLLKELIKE